MKRKVSQVLPLGITAVFLMALSLVTVQPANAQGQCGQGGISEIGPVDITHSGDCIINGSVTAGGYIKIVVTGGKIEINGNVTTAAQTIILSAADGNVSVSGTVSNSSTQNAQDIRIFTNSSAPFVIGGGGTPTNGVSAVIANTGGGALAFNTTRNILVSNSGTGGITVTHGTNILTVGALTSAASIFLDAHDGDVRIQGGNLSSNGTGFFPAGQIGLLGDKVIFTNGAGATARQDVRADAVTHSIAIAANELSYDGGLTLNADGHQFKDPSTQIASGIFFGPKGSHTYNVTLDPTAPMTVNIFTPSRFRK